MKLELNVNARKERIQTLFEENMKLIQKNLDKGIEATDLYIGKEFAYEVRELIDEATKGQNREWCVVKRGANQFTGRPESYTSETVGEEKHYKFRLHS
jgi:hypothetical protein